MNSLACDLPRTARALSLLCSLTAVALWVALGASPASAAELCAQADPPAGVPQISLTKEMPAEALYETPIPVTLRASQQTFPPGDEEKGYNLSFRDVLPVGVSYQPGSSSPAPRLIADQPAPGMTTLIWSNVADLAPGSAYSLTYRVTYDPLVIDAGAYITTGTNDGAHGAPAAGAYVNCNPRWIPQFAGNGQPAGTRFNSASSSATVAPQQTLLKAIEIEKSEPSPESELLRGLHNHQTVYTLTIRNNTQRPTDDLVVVDYLPAGLEFLGCGTTDNTTSVSYNSLASEEYPGSGPINPGNAPSLPASPDDFCAEDSRLESVAFGNYPAEGDRPAGNYTRVEWRLGRDIAAQGEIKLRYVAAIPMCPNSNTWTGAAPTPTSNGQMANLDNNNCGGGGMPGETLDETALVNYASVSGDYHALSGGTVPVSDTDSHTVTAEDLAIQKYASPDNYSVGELTRWTLRIETSEYKTFDPITIFDTVPDGMCPVRGTGSPATPDPECASSGNAADNPTLDWNVATENADGTWSMTWHIPPMNRSETTTLEFSTKTRVHYQENGADAARVLATDPLTNEVHITGGSTPICTDPADGNAVVDCSTPGSMWIPSRQDPGTPIEDDSEANVHSFLPELEKKVATPASVGIPASTVNCPAAGDSGYIDGIASVYRTGDIVCWKLRVEFPGTVSTGNVLLTDFLPPGAEFLPGLPGTGPTADNNVGVAAVIDNDSFVTFALTNPTVPEDGLVFEYVIATRMLNVVDDLDVELPHVRGNLLKMTSTNTAGAVTTYRAQADAEVTGPSLGITKGVKRVGGSPAGGYGPDYDGVGMHGAEPVEYRVDVTNSGAVDAANTHVVERLVGPYDCTMVSAISHGGTCLTSGIGAAAVTEINWTGIGVTAGSSLELNFTVNYPDSIAPGTEIPDDACVKSFDNATNDPANPFYTWVIDNPDHLCGADLAPPAHGQVLLDSVTDDSYVYTTVTTNKTRTTGLTATNNSGSTQATIGEEIFYTVSFTVQPLTTIRALSITDVINEPTRQEYVAGSALCYSGLSGFCAAATLNFNAGTNTVTLSNPLSYVNPGPGIQTVELSFRTKVTDVPANAAGGLLYNQAQFGFVDQYGTGRTGPTSTTTTTIVEPDPQITKSSDDADGVVTPGEEIEFEVEASNPTGRPPLYEAVVVDTIPDHLTLTDGNGTPLTDGQSVVLCDGTSAGPISGTFNTPNTITWNVGTMEGGTSHALSYCAEVNESPAPPAGATLTNEVEITGSSMPGSVVGERTYTEDTDLTLSVVGAQITKTASLDEATIGEKVGYTITVTLPALTNFYLFEVNDTMPDGMSLDAFGSFTCVGSCPGVPAASTSNAGQELTWDFGTIPADAAERTFTLTYQAVVDDVAGNTSGDTLSNEARNTWCTVDLATCPTDDRVSPPSATTDVDVIEPNLVIDKNVDCELATPDDECEIQPGDDFTYSITVTNNGDSTAYDAIFQDAVPSELTNVVVGATPPGVSTTTPTGANTHAWSIAELAPNDSVTITYTADLAAPSALPDPFSVVNTARVTQYWGLDSTDRADTTEEREYPAVEPTDTVTLNGNFPQARLDKTVANSGNAEINQCLTWTLTIGNDSTVADLTSINVTDVLPTGWTYCDDSTTLDGSAYSDPTIAGDLLTWLAVGDIAGGGQDIVMTFDARPTMAALDGSGNPTNPYTNNATVTGEDAGGNFCHGTGPCITYTDSDMAFANIQMPDLTISKSPDDATVAAGSWSDWSIVVTNTGTGTARNVSIREAVPTGLTFDVATHPATVICASPALCDNPVGPLAVTDAPVNSGTGPVNVYWKLDSLAPGQSVTLTLPMRSPHDAVDGTSWTNTAYVSSTERPTEVSDSGDWESVRSTDLAITKTGPATATAGENISYDLTVTNNGSSIGTGVTVSDVINTAQFEFVSATPADTVNDSCVTTGSPVVTEFECTIGDVLYPTPGTPSTATFTVVLKIKSGLTGSVSNTATVSGNEPDPDSANNTSSQPTTLGTSADVRISKALSSGSPGSIPNRGETEFTLTATNDGPSDALGVVVTDELPDGLSCVSGSPTPTSGCAGSAGEVVTWNVGTLAAGESTTITMTVRGEEVGDDWINTAEVTSTTPDGDPANNEDTETVDVTPMADLMILKDVQSFADSGEQFTYTIRVRNLGPDDAENPVVVDTLPAGLTYVGFDSDEGAATCSVTGGTPASGQTVTCLLPDFDSTIQGYFGIDIEVNAGFDLSETCVQNSASVSADTFDAVSSNNATDPEDAETCIGPNADLAIVKSAPAWGAAGHPLQYTLSVVNNGPAEATQVHAFDELPSGLSFVSATPSVGSCAEGPTNHVDCDLGTLAVGATAQIVVVAMPDDSVVGSGVLNRATVDSQTPDPDVDNNESTTTTPIENNQYPSSSNLTLSKTVSSARPRVGDLITYTLVATNHGPGAALSATLTDTLPSSLIYSSASGEGTCSYAKPQVSCQLGDIPPGATRTIVVRAWVARTGGIVNNAAVTALNDRDPSNNAAVSPITAERSTAKLKLTKKATKKRVKVGRKASFTIKVRNTSRVNAINVRVCDLIPERLSVVRKAGGKLVSGNLCWDIPVLRAGKTRTFKPVFRVANGRARSVTNPARAKGVNTRTVRARAKVSVPRKQARAGGTTG